MKTKLLILGFWCFQSFIVLGQCDKNISTNPNAPVNDEFLDLANEWHAGQGPYTVNSFLNQWSWYPPSNTQFNLNLSQGWENNLLQSLSMPMDNPFFATGTTTFIHQQASTWQYRDFRWEDGWELLWMNMGIHPNLDQALSPSVGSYYEANGILSNPLPTNVPYFVLYNRYRGILRIFANIWTNNLQPNAQEVLIGLRFDDLATFNDGLSGILRHSINFDTPLDQPTAGVAHFSPRMQATNTSSFLVADFQMGFDPCICLKEIDPNNSSLGKLEFDFQTIQTMNVDMVSRGISVQEPITAASFTDDFYNLSEINSSDYVPGHRIYTKIDGLYEDYLEKLQKYQEELNAEDDDYNFLKAFLEKVAPALTNDFVGSWTTADVVAKLKEDPDLAPLADQEVEEMLEEQRKKSALKFKTGDFTTNALKSLAKGILGIGFDFLNLELYPKKAAPVKPTTPVATFTETLYKGTIENTNISTSSQLYQPGGVTFTESSSTVGYGHGIVDLDYRNMPAYNVPVGLAALLKTPNPITAFDSELNIIEQDNPSEYSECCPSVETIYETKSDFRLRLDEEFLVALNSSLDFDMEKTETYVQVELRIENAISELTASTSEIENISNIEEGSYTNMVFDRKIQNSASQTEIYMSEWILLEELNQYVFSLNERHRFSQIQDYTPVNGLPWLNCEDEGSDGSCIPNGNPTNDFDPDDAEYSISYVKLKVLHDYYFDQIGTTGDQVNTTQVFAYELYNPENSINLIGDQIQLQNNVFFFGNYIPGVISIGEVEIEPNHPYVHEINGNEIHVNGQEVFINGTFPATVYNPYSLTVNAQNEIHIGPGIPDTYSGLSEGTHIIPEGVGPTSKTHLKIKTDFYDTPVFEYADYDEVDNFCNNSTQYQANVASAALMSQITATTSEPEPESLPIAEKSNTFIRIYPNPARSELTVQSRGNGIDQITIFDAATRPVIQKTPNGADLYQLNISNLSPGVYIIRANCGGEILSEKLVVTR